MWCISLSIFQILSFNPVLDLVKIHQPCQLAISSLFISSWRVNKLMCLWRSSGLQPFQHLGRSLGPKSHFHQSRDFCFNPFRSLFSHGYESFISRSAIHAMSLISFWASACVFELCVVLSSVAPTHCSAVLSGDCDHSENPGGLRRHQPQSSLVRIQ